MTATIMDQLEAEAHAAAKKQVMHMLQQPGQLEKVEQYKRRVSRKKASVEASLKTAMQSQLDGVRVGLDQLQQARTVIQEVKESLTTIEGCFKDVPSLCERLQDIREEHSRHSQFVTAMENLKHIFTVPDNVEKTRKWIKEGDFLHARQSLTDLENSRDDLLWELHKNPQRNDADRVLVMGYFEDIDELNDMLEKQLRLVLSRTLNTVRKEPTHIVTALRIIEWQELQDEYALQREKQSGFLPPGRPKRWREKAFEVLEESVAQRIEGADAEERSVNKLWLVKNLELTRLLVLEDLRVVKTLCAPCFPPHWNIVDRFVEMYHKCLSRRIAEVVANGLEGNEYVTMLSWVLNTYPGPELMGHPELNVDVQTMGPLLPEKSINELQAKYLENMELNYQEWMKKTLEAEQSDWRAGVAPEGDETDGFFHTSAPVIIFQMIDQNLQVTKTINQDLTFKALLLSMDQVTQYGRLYRQAIIQFKTRHFEDRSQVLYFTQYMITIVNNCLHFVELAHQLKSQYWRPGTQDPDATGRHEALLSTFQNLRDEAAQFLLEEAFLDLELHFQDLGTLKWLTSSVSVETICVTLEDYSQDYVHLRVKNFEYVISEAQNLVARRYISALLQRRLSLKTNEDRRECANKMVKESQKLKDLFARIAPKMEQQESPLDALKALAEVLKCEAEMLALDLHTLTDAYPDLNEDHLTRLLSLRGDLPRGDVRERAADAIQTKRRQPQRPTIFSQIT